MRHHQSFAMARSSIALFLATAGLVAGTVGCGGAPETKEGGEDNGEKMEKTVPGAAQSEKNKEGGEGDEREEGGEGGED